MMKQFEIGKTYQTRSVCDHDCILRYVVVARTAKTVTLQNLGSTRTRRRFKLFVRANVESLYPEGQYSMAPVLFADREVKESAE